MQSAPELFVCSRVSWNCCLAFLWSTSSCSCISHTHSLGLWLGCGFASELSLSAYHWGIEGETICFTTSHSTCLQCKWTHTIFFRLPPENWTSLQQGLKEQRCNVFPGPSAFLSDILILQFFRPCTMFTCGVGVQPKSIIRLTCPPSSFPTLPSPKCQLHRLVTKKGHPQSSFFVFCALCTMFGMSFHID